MLECLKKDVKRYTGLDKVRLIDIIKCYFHYKGIQAVVLFRLSNYFYKRGYKIVAELLHNYSIRVTGCDIAPKTQIGCGFVLPHPNGIVIGGNSIIGENVTIEHQVTLGLKNVEAEANPHIGNNVFIGAGAKLLGDIKIGNNVDIGANAVVVTDIPDNCVAVGIPAKVVKVKELK